MSEWYFTKFGNDIPLPIASTEFTNAAMSGDGKTIAVALKSYTPSSSNPDEGTPEIRVVVYRFNSQSQWAQIGGSVPVYVSSPPAIPPVITQEAFNTSDDMDANLALSYDGNILVVTNAVKATNKGSGMGIFVYNGSWSSTTGLGFMGDKGVYGVGYSSGAPQLNVGIGAINFTTRYGRVSVNQISSDGAGMTGWFTIGANGIIGINGITDSNVDNGNKSIWFGKSVKLSADGHTVAIGGYCTQVQTQTQAGKGYPVYVYDLKDYVANSQQGNYNVDYKKGTFPLASGPTDVLGERVLWLSPDGNTIAVGYPNADNNKGYVVVYVYSSSTPNGGWTQKGSKLYGAQSGDLFGASLELNADSTLMLVGSPGSNTSKGKVDVYQYSSSAGWAPATSSVLSGTVSSGSLGMQLMANTAFSAVGIVSNSTTNLVSTYGTPDVTINFTTNDDPITLLRYQAIPSDNFISSVKYGVFLESTFPTSDVIVSGMPANTYDPGTYTVTYSVPNTNQIITNKSAAGAIIYTVTKQVQVSTTLNNAAPICFYAGSKVMTDQGEIEIQNIVPQKNSIDGALVRDITMVINTESTMTLIMENALSYGMPYRHTCVTNNHMILYDEKFVKAKSLVDGLRDHKRATTVAYTGSPVYNVVMDEPSMMVVNGMTCETLHPRNIVYLRMKIQEEIVTCKDQERIKELLEQDRMIVEKANQYSAKKE